MKLAAIGVRVHSGWGAVVAVSNADAPEVIDRRKIVIIDSKIPGASQPYHYAEKLGVGKAEKYLADCAAVSERLALAAIRDILQELRTREYSVNGSAILLSSGRPLPPLASILASHALIHTADGEFFRNAFRNAFERLEIHVSGFRERELEDHARMVFGKAAAPLRQKIAKLGKTLGPPWTADQKNAALVACLVLGNNARKAKL